MGVASLAGEDVMILLVHNGLADGCGHTMWNIQALLASYDFCHFNRAGTTSSKNRLIYINLKEKTPTVRPLDPIVHAVPLIT